MPLDFSKLKPAPKTERVIDPIALFQGLRISDSSINDLWLAQGDALREWNQNRNVADITVSLNTGAGKTLVGLLVGQSLVNELRSLVLYVCSSIQLVQQTEEKAKGYGLPITTYFQGEYSNDLAMQGKAVCLTTYQALFNGKSVFANREIAGIVFDDAHTAEHILRDHFCLRISKKNFKQEYEDVCAEFTEYFHSVGKATSYGEVITGSSKDLILIPPFEVKRVRAAILNLLQESGVPNESVTTFAWEHLKDHIDLCAFVISSTEIAITPPFIPVRTLPYFTRDVRRIYLSATLSAIDGFIRTFGREPDCRISPTTVAGECERMILFPKKMTEVSDDVDAAKKMILPHKALILVPSYARAEQWEDVAKPPNRSDTTAAIDEFKQSGGTKKLLLTARYDGMDLPGDTCRVIVIDDLPSATGPLERYLWEYLGFSNNLRSTIASRIVQSFGRISRGMSDHGVAIITGRRLVEWIQIPKNQASLPRFLQKQIQLGIQLSSTIEIDDTQSTISSCLERDSNWVSAYEAFIREATHEDESLDLSNIAALAIAETKYAEKIWRRDYVGAASQLTSTLEKASSLSVSTTCWHKLWLGYSLELSGDAETARALYQQAHAGQINIPAFPRASEPIVGTSIPEQVVKAGRQFEIVGDGQVKVPRLLTSELRYLDGSGSPAQVEEALRCLGQYLGFQSSRPDNEFGTGPDVLWIIENKAALCLDAKTGKKVKAVYRKDNLGQLSDHAQWVKDNCDVEDVISGFVGPERPASDSANPQVGVKVASLEKFRAVSCTLEIAYRNIAASALPLTVNQVTTEEFERRKLLWKDLIAALSLLELRDL